MTAPGVESESETLVVALNVPGAGLKVGATVEHPPVVHPALGLEPTFPAPQEDKSKRMSSWLRCRKVFLHSQSVK